MRTSLRTHIIQGISTDLVGTEVRLCGWLETIRDHGGLLFFHLRDSSGRLQVVLNPERVSNLCWELAQSLHIEDCVAIEGKIVKRPQGKERTSLDTKDIELDVSIIELLNPCTVLPFRPQMRNQASEEQRLTYRYLDLRSDEMQKTLRVRAAMIRAMREYLDRHDFLEVETPVLARSTPEGARDFLVPSRLQHGQFYALPQSPQVFKQLLMIGGIDRYYQVARCFRDEDLRSNRQPEFTQLDLEMSFVEEEDILGIIEGMLESVGRAIGVEVTTPIQRIAYDEAMRRYGTDAPDTRFGIEITDLTDIFADTAFEVFKRFASNGAIKAITVPAACNPSRNDIEGVRAYAASLGAREPAWGRIGAGGDLESTVAKFWSEREAHGVVTRLRGDAGDLVFFMAGSSEEEVCRVLGQLRLFIADCYSLRSRQVLEFVWVYRFPMFKVEGDSGRLAAVHHPFTRPADVVPLLTGDREALLKLHSRSYDLVLNGQEIGGGSLRVYQREIQERVFESLRLNPEDIENRFGFLLRALDSGAPPHGGIALGLDRMVSLFCGRSSIREVIAFPKNQSGQCLLTGAPGQVDSKQLQEVHITTTTLSAGGPVVKPISAAKRGLK
jgi:aspartyl-tRNA synthetase